MRLLAKDNLIKLRYYQLEAVDSTFKFFETHGGTDAEGFPVKANPVVAMPTGTGKSLTIAELIKQAFKMHPQTRLVMSTHVQELIVQDLKALLSLWPNAPVGINSSGLKQRDYTQPIIFGGIKSMVGKYPQLGYRDFLLIDELHLVGTEADTQYLKFIYELMYGPDVKPGQTITKEILENAIANPYCNPYLKIIGFTATPYRQGLGKITNGPIATHFVYDLCSMEGFNRLLAECYLSPLIAKKTRNEFDTSNIKLSNNDYSESSVQQEISKQKDVTFRAVQEYIAASHNRRCGLFFASGIKHAEEICDLINSFDNRGAVCIHSKKSSQENEKNFADWKAGKVMHAVNMNSLTTGIDNPLIDIIGVGRPTVSTGLWVQALGRGTRPLYAPGYDLEDYSQRKLAMDMGGKSDCLVLDFAGNTRKLGPINDPVIPKMKGEGAPGDAPVKICPECGTYCHTKATECIVCDYEFPRSLKITGEADIAEVIRSYQPQVETFNVIRCNYSPFNGKKDNRPWIRVAYFCEGLRTFYEIVTVEPPYLSNKLDFASKSGRDWFRQRFPDEPPQTNEEILEIGTRLRIPRQIKVWLNTKHPQVMSVEW